MSTESRKVTNWASDTGKARCSPLLCTCAVHCLQPPKSPASHLQRPGWGRELERKFVHFWVLWSLTIRKGIEIILQWIESEISPDASLFTF